MNCLIWILLLCCCGSNGSCGNGSCGCNGSNTCAGTAAARTRNAVPPPHHHHHHHPENFPYQEERDDGDCFQVRRDTCDLPPFPTLSRGETCGCEASE